MGANYEGFNADYTHIDVLPAGTGIEIKDWDDDVLEKPVIHIYNFDSGAMIEGSKAQLVALLEGALQQAWSLPDDEPLPPPLAPDVKWM